MKPIELLLATLPLLGALSVEQVQAQVVTPATDGTATTVTTNGNQLDISGGQTSGDGANLFHSFEQFGLNQSQIANFISNPNIQNILAKVSGGDASVINGKLQVSGSNANFFLINPSGIIFGANASLNLNGAFTATTANGIGFGSNWFSATGANNYASLTGTPSAFAFTMEQPGAIVNAGNLSVGEGKNLTLLAGTVANTGQLDAPQGAITVAAVPGKSIVRISQAGNVLSLDVQPMTTTSTQPNNWTMPILSLPQLLTGGGGGNATGLAVNSNGQVELIGSGIGVENGDVLIKGDIDTSSSTNAGGSVALFAHRSITVTGDIKTTGLDESEFNKFLSGYVGLTANKGDIELGNITTGSGGSVKLSAIGNINAGNINAGYFVDPSSIDTSVQLSSSTGNIVVETIDAGPGGINVIASGIFQAKGKLPVSFFPEEAVKIKDSPELINFLEAQGIPREQLINSETEVVVVREDIPVSIIVRPKDGRGSIIIQHTDASKIDDPLSNDRIIITPPDEPFKVGPTITKVGEGFKLEDGVTALEGFDPSLQRQDFRIIRTESYRTTDLSNDNSSGTAGAIFVGFGGDAGLVSSLLGRTFGSGGTGGTGTGGIVTNPGSGSTGNSSGDSGTGNGGNSGVVINPGRTKPDSGSTNNTSDTTNDTDDSSEDNQRLNQQTQTAMSRQSETLDFGILVLDKSLVASLESTGHATRLSVGSDGNGELTGSDLEAEEEKKISLNQRLSTYPGIYLTDNSYGNVQK